MEERVYKLLDGLELIISEEALFVRIAEGRPTIATSEEVMFDRVLELVDHMQQQIADKDETISSLRKALEEVQAIIGVLPMDNARLWGVYNRLYAALAEGDHIVG
ncbi:hypothetical protein [Paenibacillus lutimineralis]|uniref:Uncharacterized protein n=1 Tax=Paenibacillus lutimineralis TaxID=2707005 RepID=A0A3Q9IAJ0_9BACL|nr:hypothetical protein [Paenibacillus lutimineralis]AZS16460.1 hypothetical protein EI981_19730 [Paenibacillus lutimineralis]